MRRSAFLLASFALGPALAARARAHPGVGVVVDGKGNVFFTDLRQVWRIAPDGTKSVAVPRVHSHELYLDPQGNLFGEHLWYEGDATRKWGHRVWRLSADGRLEDVIPSREGFLTGYSFVRDARGAMYWAGDGGGDAGPRRHVRRRSPDGVVSTLAGGSAGREDGKGRDARFADVRWLAASPDGTVYAIDDGSLRRISPDGVVTTLASGLDERRLSLFDDHRHDLMGLAPDAEGNVFVAFMAGRQVKKVGPDGKVSVFARSRARWSPTGVTVAPSGDVFILECAGEDARVRQISPDGADRIL